jgi:WD40 repeat protein
MSKVTGALKAQEQGDPRAAAQLLSLVYDGLRKLAALACLALAGAPVAAAAELPRGQKAPAGTAPGDAPLPPGVVAHLGTTRFRHDYYTRLVFFSQDGKRLVSAALDGSVAVWDPATGRALGRFPAAHLRPTPVCLSPNGRILVTYDRRFHRWDLRTGEELAWSPGRRGRDEGEDATWTVAAFSADGRFLATGHQVPDPRAGPRGPDLVFRTWEVRTGRLVRRVVEEGRGNLSGFHSFFVSPTGTALLASGGEAVRVHEPGGKCIWQSREARYAPTFSPDGKLVAAWAAPQGPLVVLDAATGKKLCRLPAILGFTGNAPGHGGVFSRDGKYLAGVTAAEPHTLLVYEAATGKRLHAFPWAQFGANAITFAPDGRFLAAAHADGIKVWDLRTDRLLRAVRQPRLQEVCLDISPDGKTLAAATDHAAVRLWDLATGRSVPGLPGLDVAVLALAFSPDGTWLAAADYESVVALWRLPSGRQVAQFPASPPDGTCPLFLICRDHGQVQAVRVPGGERRPDTPLRPSPYLWDPATGKKLCTFSTASEYLESFALSADGKRLAVGGLAQTHVWDVRTGKELLALPWHQRGPRGSHGAPTAGTETVTLSPDGRALALRGGYQNPLEEESPRCHLWLELWELSSGKLRRRLEEHIPPDPGTEARAKKLLGSYEKSGRLALLGSYEKGGRLIFGPGGRTAALGSGDTVRLLDLGTGAELRRFGGPGVEADTAAFSPDGRYVAARALDGTMRLWEAATGAAAGRLRAGKRGIVCFAFAPDGRRLATGGADGLVLLWDLARVAAGKAVADAPKTAGAP